MQVVHVLPSISTSWGGPPAALRALTTALGAEGVENTVVAFGSEPSASTGFPDVVIVRTFRRMPAVPISVPLDPLLTLKLGEIIDHADIVHLHEIWHPLQLAASLLAIVTDRPYLVSPHGELDVWALRQHRWGKAVAWQSYQRRVMERAACIHALTDSEALAVASHGIKTRVRVIPNGIDLDWIDSHLRAASSSESWALRPLPPYVVYVGRVHPKKGVQVLLDAFARASQIFRKLSLVIAGPDQIGMWGSLARRAQDLGVGGRVFYLGEVTEEQKYALLAAADLFALPSLSEGLSVAVLEALACSVPVVVSHHCNIPEVEKAEAGYVVDPDSEQVASAILSILQDNKLSERMASNARRLAEDKFSVKMTSHHMLRLYNEVLGSVGR